ncbi:Sulfoquinovosyl transferase sqd2 [Quaeritorhiza haematococci]|nr:Sulfoquinovosyl transferase sqd2 [Quaeritorhiza haematococci]
MATAAAKSDSGRRMHILLATEYFPPYVSGIANRCKNLVKVYKENGHEVTVYSVVGTGCDHVVTSIPNIFYERQRMFILPPLGLTLELLNFFKPLPYDIIHVVTPMCWPFVYLLPLFWLRGVKIYVSYHVYLQYYKNLYIGNHPIIGAILETLFILIYFIPLVYFADVVGVPSKTADSFVFKYSKKIHIMKSGLDTNVFVPRDGDDDERTVDNADDMATIIRQRTTTKAVEDNDKMGPTLVYVGRLAVEKNIEFLIEALAHPSLQNARLVIVGDGPIRKSLEALASRVVGPKAIHSGVQSRHLTRHDSAFGLDTLLGTRQRFASVWEGKRVIFTGMILNEHDIAQYYAQGDVFVSASASETFGFTVAEAMACGTPSVVVRGGAYATVYAKVIDDWLFEEGNTEDYVAKINKAWKEEGKAARKRSRKIAVEHFSVRAAVGDLLKTYGSAVFGEGK